MGQQRQVIEVYFDEIASQVNGRARGLTEAGQAERQHRTQLQRKARRIHSSQDVRGADWYQALVAGLFAPEHEGTLWVWVDVNDQDWQ